MGSAATSITALVTGGGGFLGQAIVRRLLARGDHVHTLQRGDYPELAALGAVNHSGDLTNYDAVAAATEGCDVVFHTAAKVGVWGRYRDFFRCNVVGTRNVLAACRQHQVRRMVYTSSPSVVFDGGDGHQVNESAPYSKHFLSNYPKTKAMAESEVLSANDAGLRTVALRPHLIWGPGDRHLVPRIVNRARSGQLRLIGRGDNLVDITFIDNAVDAHLAAADRLLVPGACAGKAYFISDGDPRPLRELIHRILAAAQLPPVDRSLSPRVAYVLAGILEFIHASLRLETEPVITRFVVQELATSHWFDLTAARHDLSYVPQVEFEEGMRRLHKWLCATSDNELPTPT